MSEKSVILENQAKLTQVQIAKVEEIQEHLVKALSLVDVITNSIEAKNKDNVLDLASELNSMVAVYDELQHGADDAAEVLSALKETVADDTKNA
jgi:allophanate hydrolase subunit 1